MFVPNRFLTVKEQILLLSTMAVVLLGIGMLYFYQDKDAAESLSSDLSPGGYRRIVPGTSLPSGLPRGKPQSSRVSRPEPLPAPAPRKKESDIPLLEEPKEDLAIAPAFSVEPKQVGVAVMGAVARPGFYRIDAHSRLSDLIARAGNALDTADLSELLVTAQVVDGTTLTVPYHSYLETDAEGLALRRPETDYRLNPDLYLRRPPRRTAFTTERRADGSGNRASEQSPASGTSSAQGKLHLNTATAQELQTLPGIGSVLSAAIVVEREKGDFSSPDDLLRVPGIGAKRLDAIRELITAP